MTTTETTETITVIYNGMSIGFTMETTNAYIIQLCKNEYKKRLDEMNNEVSQIDSSECIWTEEKESIVVKESTIDTKKSYNKARYLKLKNQDPIYCEACNKKILRTNPNHFNTKTHKEKQFLFDKKNKVIEKIENIQTVLNEPQPHFQNAFQTALNKQLPQPQEKNI